MWSMGERYTAFFALKIPIFRTADRANFLGRSSTVHVLPRMKIYDNTMICVMQTFY